MPNPLDTKRIKVVRAFDSVCTDVVRSLADTVYTSAGVGKFLLGDHFEKAVFGGRLYLLTSYGSRSKSRFIASAQTCTMRSWRKFQN